MVPMIDVVFQLLLFLMIMPATGEQEGYLPTNLPENVGQTPGLVLKPVDIAFRIDLLHVEPYEGANKSLAIVRLNQEELPGNRELRMRLRQARARLEATGADIGKTPVLISPDMGVWYKHVVAAFDASVDAGFKNIQFTIPK